ncbi:hypothetical protein [Natronorubrum halophilum]|uniref:hypothetical protein n=1 Tax=Natronorubrum halophilum TaxID=1702106 RepID=UPI001EE8A14A|nr:hypothetical protein [Natronorubrum halophilum]
MMKSWQLYAVGYGLALLGSLVVVASLVLAGLVAYTILVLPATFVLVNGLVSIHTREDLDRKHSLAYRVGNWGGAVITVALGFLMLAVGIVSFNTFV